MTLDEILKEWANDAPINKNKLDEESLNISVLHAKYISLFARERALYMKMLREKTRVFELLVEYYNGNMTNEECETLLNRKQSLKDHTKLPKDFLTKKIENDPLYSDMILKIGIQETKLETLKDILKTVHSRNFLIKNTIEFKKFMREMGD